MIFGPVNRRVGGVPASQNCGYHAKRGRARFGALLVHSSVQMGWFGATDSALSYSKDMKRGEYEQGR